MEGGPRSIRACAPVRILDLGGWTDTWFAEEGACLSLAVTPGVEATITTSPAAPGADPVYTITAFGQTATTTRSAAEARKFEGEHVLIQAALSLRLPPPGTDCVLTIASDCPPASSVGSSASASVAVLGALDRLAGAQRTRQEVAEAAFEVESTVLGWQTGVQDQAAAAVGGVCWTHVDGYPKFTASALSLPGGLATTLEECIVLVYLGRHCSSDVHTTVIKSCEELGRDFAPLVELRRIARGARAAVAAAAAAAGGGDAAAAAAAAAPALLEALGGYMVESTAAQQALHCGLVGAQATAVFEAAKRRGALGWKVNGAGGDGGSVTVLFRAGGEGGAEREAFVGDVAGGLGAVLDFQLSPQGLRVWEGGEECSPSS